MSPTSGCLQDKIVVLSDANAVLDAAAHEAKAAQSRTQQEKVSKASPSRRSSSTLAQQHSSADHAQKHASVTRSGTRQCLEWHMVLQVKIDQSMEVLKSHNTWLEEELSTKTEAVQQERRSVASQVRLCCLYPLPICPNERCFGSRQSCSQTCARTVRLPCRWCSCSKRLVLQRTGSCSLKPPSSA